MAAVLIPIDYFETYARCPRFRVRGRAFERFDQRQIAVPETKRGSKPAVDASCTLKSTMFSPKLTPGWGHEDWFLPESLNGGCRPSKRPAPNHAAPHQKRRYQPLMTS